VALAPDLFSRWDGDRDALRRGDVRVTLPDGEVAAVIDREIDFVDLAACVVFYGASQQHDWEASALQPRRMGDLLRKLHAPALFVFAERDHTISLDDVRYRPKEAAQAWQLLLALLAEVFSGQWNGRVRWEFEGASSPDYDFAKKVRLE
jgi:carboxymethylenebutenolidase